MHIGSCTFYLSIPWAKSLKDKRKCLKSLTERLKKFNISIAEIAENDNHNIAHIGFVCISSSKTHAETMVMNIIEFVENNTEAEVYGIEVEML